MNPVSSDSYLFVFRSEENAERHSHMPGCAARSTECARVAGDGKCIITYQTFDTLFKEAQNKKEWYIARVDSGGFSKFYDAYAACEWLACSFHDPITRGQVDTVTLFQYRYEKANEVFLDSIYSTHRQAGLLPMRQRIIGKEDVDGQLRVLKRLVEGEKYEEVLSNLQVVAQQVQEKPCGDIDAEYEEVLKGLGKLALHEAVQAVDEAAIFFGKLVEAHPGDVQGLVGLAMSYLDDDRNKAMNFLEQALLQDPGYPQAVILLVELLEGDDPKANFLRIRALLEQAHTRAYNEEVFINLVSHLLDSDCVDDLHKAYDLVTERLRIHPADDFALQAMVYFYEKRKDDMELRGSLLVKYLEAAFVESYERVYILEKLIEIYTEGLLEVEPNRRNAVEYMEQSVAIFPNREYFKELVTAYSEGLYGIEKNLSKASAFLKSFSSFFPKDAFVRETTSRIYFVNTH